MQTIGFEESVRQYAQKKRVDENAVDWEERKTWWQGRVAQLFNEIQDWLKPLIDSKTIEFSEQSIALTEEYLGDYEVESCTIKLQHQKLTFKPAGSLIIGGYGRVDVNGPHGTAMLVLCPAGAIDFNIGLGMPNLPKEKSEWFLSYPKQLRGLSPFSKEVFEKLFADLFGIDE